VYGLVRDAALGLAAIGLRPGDFAVVWAGNRSEATICDYAVMHAGAVPVFIYPTVSADQGAYIAGHCEATLAIVERQYLDKLESVRGQLPKLRQIVVIDPEADPGIGDGTGAEHGRETVAGVISWSRLLDLGRAEAEAAPGLFEETWRQVSPDDLATLIYTSGTTGTPKGAMLTHRNVRYTQAASLRLLPIEARFGADGAGMLVSFLPMAHVTGRHPLRPRGPGPAAGRHALVERAPHHPERAGRGAVVMESGRLPRQPADQPHLEVIGHLDALVPAALGIESHPGHPVGWT